MAQQKWRVLHLAAMGCTADEFVQLLTVSPHTVMSYVKRAHRKLHVRSEAEARRPFTVHIA